MKFTTAKLKKGFTLIELLVVISIIALLSTIVIASLSRSQMLARDSKRQQDIQNIRTALNLYAGENGGKYPAPSGLNWVYSNTPQWEQLETSLSKYITKLPKDPLNRIGDPACYSGVHVGPWCNGNYVYAYYPVGNTGEIRDYDLAAQFENTSNPQRCSVKGYIFNYYVFFNSPTKIWCAPEVSGAWGLNHALSPYLFTDH